MSHPLDDYDKADLEDRDRELARELEEDERAERDRWGRGGPPEYWEIGGIS